MKNNILLNTKNSYFPDKTRKTNILKKILLSFIKKYKKYISPIFEHFGIHCKYYPTCSEYARQAVEKYGIIKGLWLSIKRFLKCNPFSKGGYDPVK